MGGGTGTDFGGGVIGVEFTTIIGSVNVLDKFVREIEPEKRLEKVIERLETTSLVVDINNVRYSIDFSYNKIDSLLGRINIYIQKIKPKVALPDKELIESIKKYVIPKNYETQLKDKKYPVFSCKYNRIFGILSNKLVISLIGEKERLPYILTDFLKYLKTSIEAIYQESS